VEVAPEIDGVLDDPVWLEAKMVNDFAELMCFTSPCRTREATRQTERSGAGTLRKISRT
jgi:hypothetical protein